MTIAQKIQDTFIGNHFAQLYAAIESAQYITHRDAESFWMSDAPPTATHEHGQPARAATRPATAMYTFSDGSSLCFECSPKHITNKYQ